MMGVTVTKRAKQTDPCVHPSWQGRSQSQGGRVTPVCYMGPSDAWVQPIKTRETGVPGRSGEPKESHAKTLVQTAGL